MSQVVFTKVVKRLLNVFGPPSVPDPDALYEEFGKALKGFSESILDEAIDRVMREHVYASWPSLGECVKHCRNVAYERSPRSAPEHQKLSEDLDKPSVDEATAKQLMASFNSSLLVGNSFDAIVDRCPIGGTVDVSAPWGMEVTDKDGKIVPIRKRKGEAA
ncbi:hypothetical protein [Hyphomicrobium sp. MC1]|uniref:hypothetical protein n=1 Tax=Hyphomicrobium sp. (strain MC1) TaxID=717785 RepID=UPI000213DA9D|nr:hypothetical protein [Hyphomicrobium sp. MC1]CCB64450.1 protein of unknown function [Hyphomicrobium sp. MC1]